MTVAERMRRDGWRKGFYGWVRYECGVWLFLNECGWLAQTPWLSFYEAPKSWAVPHGQSVGLTSLAQRAKAAARKLARQWGRKP